MMTPRQLTGLTDSHLIKVDTGYQTLDVHHQVGEPLLDLVSAARQAGLQLHIASGFRGFERQRLIWNNKFGGKSPVLDSTSHPLDIGQLSEKALMFAILRWSALPGASRHHWGTDFDIYAKNLLPADTRLQLEPWEYIKGHQKELHLWLEDQLSQHGFFLPYNKDLGGVAPEPWHISHREESQACSRVLSIEHVRDALHQEEVLGLDIIDANLETIYTQYIQNICLE